MDNQNDKSFAIYLKNEECWIPVSEEFYQEYSRMNNTFRRKMKRHGCCSCPKNKAWLCDSNCQECIFCEGLLHVSLDALSNAEEDDDSPETIGEFISNGSNQFEDDVLEHMLISMLYEKLKKLDPTERQIIELLLSGKSERDIAEILGLKKQSVVNYQKKKAIERLRQLML